MLQLTRCVARIELSDDQLIAGQYDGELFVSGVTLNDDVITEDALPSAERLFAGGYIFADHQTFSEYMEQPERSTKSIVGTIRKVWRAETNGVPSIRAQYFISKSAQWLRDLIDEGIVSDMSIEAYVNGDTDETDGRFHITSFADPETQGVYPPAVAVVTYAAAGGSISQRQLAASQHLIGLENNHMFNQLSNVGGQNTDETTLNLQSVQTAIEQAMERLEASQLANVRQAEALSIRAELSTRIGDIHPDVASRINREVENVCVQYSQGQTPDGFDLRERVSEIETFEREYAQRLIGSNRPNMASYDWQTDVTDVAEEVTNFAASFDAMFGLN